MQQMAVPRDPERMRYALVLFDFAFDFLLGHELMHISHGHVDYLDDKYHQPFIAELGWHSPGPDVLLERQTLEMDADSGAATAVGMATIRLNAANLASPDFRWGPHCRTPGDALFTWTFAVCSLFRLFGDVRIVGRDLLSDAYPPPGIRQGAVLAAAITHIVKRKWDADLINSAGPITRRAVAEVERAFADLTGAPVPDEGLKESLGPLGRDHAMRLYGNWQTKLRGELLPHAYGYLPD
jgi:hypothetical protein